MIRKAVAADLAMIESIYDEILTKEEKEGSFTNWIRGVYPTVKVAEKALEAGTLFVGEEDEKLYGCVILNKEQLPEYAEIPWSIEADSDKVFVIHTLCIRPSESGKGRGREFVSFAEDYGRKQGCTVMRLDTYEGNIPAAQMYPKLGYKYAGKALFNFQQRILENLICFEKEL